MSGTNEHEAAALPRHGQSPLPDCDTLFLDLDGTIVKFEQHPLAAQSNDARRISALVEHELRRGSRVPHPKLCMSHSRRDAVKPS